LNKRTYTCALPAAGVGLMLAGSGIAANAREVRASFSVSVTVLAMARIERQTEPATLEITAADLRRGFLDVQQPTTLLVRSNSPNGFALDLSTVPSMLESVIVHGFADDQPLGPEGGRIVQRWYGTHSMDLSLTFRLVLAPGLAPGIYPWPVHLAVRPLEGF